MKRKMKFLRVLRLTQPLLRLPMMIHQAVQALVQVQALVPAQSQTLHQMKFLPQPKVQKRMPQAQNQK